MTLFSAANLLLLAPMSSPGLIGPAPILSRANHFEPVLQCQPGGPAGSSSHFRERGSTEGHITSLLLLLSRDRNRLPVLHLRNSSYMISSYYEWTTPVRVMEIGNLLTTSRHRVSPSPESPGRTISTDGIRYSHLNTAHCKGNKA